LGSANGDTPVTSGEPNPLDRLDEVDRAIVRKLQEDGRTPFRQIARDLGVSEGTVRYRAGRLQSSGALTIAAIADPFRLGYRVLAFVLIKVEPGRVDDVVAALSSWQEATYVSTCTGGADIYVQLVCRDNEQLSELLHHQLPAIGGVREMDTYMELKMHKVAYAGYAPSVEGPAQ
jgi:Lrp/AsnC family transcriptional regulator for asnA, asnC and gidA